MKKEQLSKLSFPKAGIGNLQRLSFSQAYGNSGGVEDPRTLRAATSSGMKTLLNNTPSSVPTGHLPPHGEVTSFNAPSTWRERAECVSTGVRGNIKEEPRNQNVFKAPLRAGFTLIEILVVVLIIGILAAVALPQYQRAVEKAAAAEALPILDAVWQAAQVYYLTHGDYPNKFEDLDVTLPWTGKEKWRQHDGVIKDTISNDKWSLQIYKENNFTPAFYLGRISGKYAGTGFGKSMPSSVRLCVEKTSDGYVFNGEPGDYCVKLFHANTPPSTYPNGRYYAMP